eukprot:scaffold19864_cov72-Skeletonema_dohrnii-CCMP3373.AAC.2
MASCTICYETDNANEMVTCAAESTCSCAFCHDCLVTCFSRPWRMINGQLIEYDPTKCPLCLGAGAFSLDERDAAAVAREMGRIIIEDASVGASYASTSHEQSDSEWEMSEEGDDEASYASTSHQQSDSEWEMSEEGDDEDD